MRVLLWAFESRLDFALGAARKPVDFRCSALRAARRWLLCSTTVSITPQFHRSQVEMVACPNLGWLQLSEGPRADRTKPLSFLLPST